MRRRLDNALHTHSVWSDQLADQNNCHEVTFTIPLPTCQNCPHSRKCHTQNYPWCIHHIICIHNLYMWCQNTGFCERFLRDRRPITERLSHRGADALVLNKNFHQHAHSAQNTAETLGFSFQNCQLRHETLHKIYPIKSALWNWPYNK